MYAWVSLLALTALLVAADSRLLWYSVCLTAASVWASGAAIGRALRRPERRSLRASSSASADDAPFDVERVADAIGSYVTSRYERLSGGEPQFPAAFRESSERAAETCREALSRLDPASLAADVARVLVRHLKEYERARGRARRDGAGDVRDHYRRPADRSVAPTGALARRLLPRESGDAPQARLLAAVVAKRTDSLVSGRVSDPGTLRLLIARAVSIRPRAPSGERPPPPGPAPASRGSPAVPAADGDVEAEPTGAPEWIPEAPGRPGGLWFGEDDPADADLSEEGSSESTASGTGDPCGRSGPADSPPPDRETPPTETADGADLGPATAHSRSERVLGDESPDYEYEEAEDLPSAIAKLRCLLERKTVETAPTTAEGRDASETEETVSVHGSDPDDEFATPPRRTGDPSEAYDAVGQRFAAAGNVFDGNNIQRLDKLLTRTVTGVLNTLKTAVGGEAVADAVPGRGEECADGPPDGEPIRESRPAKFDWCFVPGDGNSGRTVSRLISERKDCIVEAAQDSLDMLGDAGEPAHDRSPENVDVDVDSDRADVYTRYPLWQMCVELLATVSSGPFRKDILLKTLTNTFGETVERRLQNDLIAFNERLKSIIFDYCNLISGKDQNAIFLGDGEEDIDQEELCDAILKKIPAVVSYTFGHKETYEAIDTVLSSLQYQDINRDVIYSILDVFACYLLKASSVDSVSLTPPPSA